jgi:DNA-binding NarL/FixJ family response regulator
MRVLLIGADRTPARAAEDRLDSVAELSVERVPRLSGRRAQSGKYDACLVWHELLDGLDRPGLRDLAILSRRMPMIALMSFGDWIGARPVAALADGWAFLEVDLPCLPEIVRLAVAGYWTAPGALLGERSEALRRRAAMRALTVEQLTVLRQLADGRSNREIATRLGMPEPAVKKLVHAIITRLGLANRTQAAIMALSTLPSAASAPREAPCSKPTGS